MKTAMGSNFWNDENPYHLIGDLAGVKQLFIFRDSRLDMQKNGEGDNSLIPICTEIPKTNAIANGAFQKIPF